MYIYNGSKNQRSGTGMQKRKWRGGERRFHEARKTLPGFPKSFQFSSDEEVAEYLSGDRVCCLLCGKHYKSLAPHLRVHGIDADKYKEIYNIRSGVGLERAETADRHRAAALANDFNHAQRKMDYTARKRMRKPVHTTYSKAKRAEHLKNIASLGGCARRPPTISSRGVDLPASRFEFLDLIAAGETTEAACKSLGIGRTTYKRWLKGSEDFTNLYVQARLDGSTKTRRNPGGRPRTFDYAEIIRLHSEDGLGCAEIARRTGVHYHSVYRVLGIRRETCPAPADLR